MRTNRTAECTEHEPLLPCRQTSGTQAAQRQPKGGGAQNVGQPTAALLPGEEADAAPVRSKPARDLSTPRAEQLLHAQQRQTKRWHAQATRLQKELDLACRSAHSERQAYRAVLHDARASFRYFGAKVQRDDEEIGLLYTQRNDALAASAKLEEELRRERQARMGAQAEAHRDVRAARAANLRAANLAAGIEIIDRQLTEQKAVLIKVCASPSHAFCLPGPSLYWLAWQTADDSESDRNRCQVGWDVFVVRAGEGTIESEPAVVATSVPPGSYNSHWISNGYDECCQGGAFTIAVCVVPGGYDQDGAIHT